MIIVSAQLLQQRSSGSGCFHLQDQPAHVALPGLDHIAQPVVLLVVLHVKQRPSRKQTMSGPFLKIQRTQGPAFFASTCLNAIDHTILTSFIRQEHEMGSRRQSKPYSITTSTSILRGHLLNHHSDTWFKACEKLSISITAKCAQAKLAQFQGRPQETRDTAQSASRKCFSNETFLDALVEFIAADDQVSFNFPFISDTTEMLYLHSLSMLSRARNCVLYFSCCEKSSKTKISPIAPKFASGYLKYGMNISSAWLTK